MVTIIFQDGTVQEQILHRQADGSYTALHGLTSVPVAPVPVLTRQGGLSKTTCLYQEVPSASPHPDGSPHELAHLLISVNVVAFHRRLDALERQFHEFLDRNPSAADAGEAQP